MGVGGAVDRFPRGAFVELRALSCRTPARQVHNLRAGSFVSADAKTEAPNTVIFGYALFKESCCLF